MPAAATHNTNTAAVAFLCHGCHPYACSCISATQLLAHSLSQNPHASKTHPHLLQSCEEGSGAEPLIQVGCKVLAHHVPCVGCLPPDLHGPHMRAGHTQQGIPAGQTHSAWACSKTELGCNTAWHSRPYSPGWHAAHVSKCLLSSQMKPIVLQQYATSLANQPSASHGGSSADGLSTQQHT